MYRIGVDLGGTNIAVGLVDENMKLVAKKTTPTEAQRPAEAIVDDIAKLCLALCEEKGIAPADIESAGIASPGIANPKRMGATSAIIIGSPFHFSFLPFHCR